MIEFLENLFSPLTNIFSGVLEFFHYSLDAPWWLSIVILTVLVRSLLFPLTARQVKNMRAMQDLKPEMDKLRTKYKDNKQKQQEEIMKLYQERQVNPIGGCFPLLVQMPIFITMYYVIRSFSSDTTHDFASGGILWFKDLTIADPYYILPILSAVTMYAASHITSKNLDPQQRWLMRILPVGITVVLISFPAGLFMYWISSNLVTLAQNYLIYNHGPGKKSPPENQQVPVKRDPAQSPTTAPQDGTAKPEQKAKAASSRRRRRKKKR